MILYIYIYLDFVTRKGTGGFSIYGKLFEGQLYTVMFPFFLVNCGLTV